MHKLCCLSSLLLLTIIMAVGQEQAQLPSVPQAKDFQPSPIVMIGLLELNAPKAMRYPSEYVLEDGYLYQAAPYHAGSMYLYTDKLDEIAALVAQTVVIYGTVEQDLNKILKKQGKAPEDYGREESMMQMRSDWVAPETGFNIGRSTHERLKTVRFVRINKVVEFKGFQVQTAAGKTEVVFTNQLDRPISELTFTGHYESTGGKPVPHEREETCPSLAPGQTVRFVFPDTIKKDRHYRLWYLEVSAPAPVPVQIRAAGK